MNDQMLKLLAVATVLAPVVSGIVQIMKKYTIAEGKLLPVLGVFCGIVIGGLWGVSFAPNEVIAYLWSGLIAGLASVGVFELAKGPETVDKDDQENNRGV